MTTFIAFFVVLTSGGSDTETDGATPSAQTPTSGTRTKTTRTRTDRVRRTYTVKPGDTPSDIADQVGISLDRLVELNPDVDPQLLAPGQRLKISP